MIDFLLQVGAGLIVAFLSWLAASLWSNWSKKQDATTPTRSVSKIQAVTVSAGRVVLRIAATVLVIAVIPIIFFALQTVLGLAGSFLATILGVIIGLIAFIRARKRSHATQ